MQPKAKTGIVYRLMTLGVGVRLVRTRELDGRRALSCYLLQLPGGSPVLTYL